MTSDPRIEIATDENFHEDGYLAANPDVKAAGVSGRLHFERFGRREGRMQFAGLPTQPEPMRITVLGNCQAPVLALCLRAMLPDAEVHGVHLGLSDTGPSLISDLIFLQTEFSDLVDNRAVVPERLVGRTKLWPTFYYSAFHPDLVYAHAGDGFLRSPMHDYNSALVLYGWLNEMSVERTVALFNEDVFEALGYFAYAGTADAYFTDDCDRAGLDGQALLRRLKEAAPFCHAVNHPSLAALARIGEGLLDAAGIAPAVRGAERFLGDPLLSGPVWPVYPPIAERMGVRGSYDFKMSGAPGRVLDLERFVVNAFALYGRHARSDVRADRLQAQASLYRDLETLTRASRPRSANPYAKLPDHCFWRRTMTGIAPADLDPVTRPKFRLTPQDRISTAGSCFAQHIARTLTGRGFNYFVTETGAAPGEGADRQPDLFSARFGNIYSARQLLQLAQRAYGTFEPRDEAWIRPDGRYVDPFRPQVEAAGYAAVRDVTAALPGHFAAIRRMFEGSDLFIFTVGLTEIWESTVDGAVFPVAPGVVARPDDPSLYRFRNMDVAEIRADLDAFIALVRAINPGLRILLTVSPVPLVATYEDQNVLLSTTYSKSALRSAVGETCRQHDFVDYFPSYEIVTNWYNGGRYFQDDLRSVSDSGVDHVMRVFGKHYLAKPDTADGPAASRQQDPALRSEFARSSRILCDEEALDAQASA